MTLNIPTTFKSPQFVLELIALSAVNILAYVSGEVSVAIAVDGLVLGFHISNA